MNEYKCKCSRRMMMSLSRCPACWVIDLLNDFISGRDEYKSGIKDIGFWTDVDEEWNKKGY